MPSKLLREVDTNPGIFTLTAVFECVEYIEESMGVTGLPKSIRWLYESWFRLTVCFLFIFVAEADAEMEKDSNDCCERSRLQTGTESRVLN